MVKVKVKKSKKIVEPKKVRKAKKEVAPEPKRRGRPPSLTPPTPRSTVSLECTTIDKLRRLCRAWEEHDGRLPSVNEIVDDAAEMLMDNYRADNISIPKEARALRPGPKPREEADD
tara:strand:- start:23268 stop:23615 length:348 start_codon:yes stop_codon:yes gene_type:complete